MDKAINLFKKRRRSRIDDRYGKHVDEVEKYRERRNKRIENRFDAGVGWVFGALKNAGVDTEGMSVGDAFDKWNEINKGKTNKQEDGTKSKYGNFGVKGGKRIAEHFLKNSERHYDRAKEQAEKFSELTTYTDHRFDHVQMVMKKSIEGADLVDKIKGKSDFYKPVDRKTMLAAAAYHDTGMDGGVRVYSNGNKLRKDHPINSAMHILEDRKAFEDMGIDADDAAVMAIGHSKSSSALGNLRRMDQYERCFDKIDEVVGDWNKENPGKKIEFHREKYCDENGKPDPDKLGGIASGIAALRLGDANRDKPEKNIAQNGEEYELDWNSYDPEADGAMEEARHATAYLVGENGKKRRLGDGDIDPDAYSRKAVYGEGNINSMNAELDDGALWETFEVNDGRLFPYCTVDAIKERVGELATMNGIPSGVKIVINGDYNDEERKKIERIYGAAIDDMERQYNNTMSENEGNNKNGHGFKFKTKIEWGGRK